jgi:hypothetical protein
MQEHHAIYADALLPPAFIELKLPGHDEMSEGRIETSMILAIIEVSAVKRGKAP